MKRWLTLGQERESGQEHEPECATGHGREEG